MIKLVKFFLIRSVVLECLNYSHCFYMADTYHLLIETITIAEDRYEDNQQFDIIFDFCSKCSFIKLPKNECFFYDYPT